MHCVASSDENDTIEVNCTPVGKIALQYVIATASTYTL